MCACANPQGLRCIHDEINSCICKHTHTKYFYSNSSYFSSFFQSLLFILRLHNRQKKKFLIHTSDWCCEGRKKNALGWFYRGFHRTLRRSLINIYSHLLDLNCIFPVISFYSPKSTFDCDLTEINIRWIFYGN